MIPRGPLLVLLALVAAAPVGSATEAPLAETRKELKQLGEKPGVVAEPGVRDALRSGAGAVMTGPSLDQPLVPPVTPERTERERKRVRDSQQNWLLNGMQRLRGEERVKGDPASRDEPTPESDLVDTTDPAYLLKLYDRQRRASAGQAPKGRADAAAKADPMAAFLQGWLQGSPVRDQLLTERLAAGTGSTSLLPGNLERPALIRGSGGPGLVATPQGEPPSGPLANPFLTGMNRPADGFGASIPVPTGGGSRVVPPPAPALPARPSPLTVAPAEPTPEARKHLLPPSADDKKYFPQLKRF